MTSAAHPILTASNEPNWRTPEWLRAALRREFAPELDCSADSEDCSVADDWLGPGSAYGVEDALLLEEWGSIIPPSGALFCNPPYSRKLGMPIEPWIERMARTGLTHTMIGLIPFAPQTQAWQKYVIGFDFRATEIRKFPFRIKFDPPPDYVITAKDGKTHGANVNTAVVIWKPTSEYPRRLPWAPFERYWVPTEHPRQQAYMKAVELTDEEE